MSKRQRKQLHKKRSMNKLARMIGSAAAAIPLAIAIPVMASAEQPAIVNPVPVAPSLSALMATTEYANQLVAGNSFSVDLSQVYPDYLNLDFSAAVQNKPIADAAIEWLSGKPYLRLSLKKTGTTSIDLQVTPKGSAAFHEKFQITVATNSALDPNNTGINLGELVKYIKNNKDKFQSTGEFRNLLKSAVSSTVTEPNHAPVAAEGTLPVEVKSTKIIDLNDFFSDADGDSLTYQMGSLPSGSSLPFSAAVVGSDLMLTATDVNANAYEIYVTANDGHEGTATKHFSVTSTMTPTVPVNHAPVAIDPEPKDITVNISSTEELSTTLNLNEYFSDADNDALTYSIINVPGSGQFFSTSLTASQLVLHGSYVSSAPYSLTVQVSDGYLTSTKTFNISTVSIDPPVNHAPVARNSETQNIVADLSSTQEMWTTLDMNEFITDEDGDELTYTIVNPPSSSDFFTAALTGSELKIQGVYPSTEPYLLEVRASDGSLTGSKFISITSVSIDPVNHAPEATEGIQELSVESTRNVDLSPYFSDADEGDTLTYQVGELQSGLPFTASVTGSDLTLTATGMDTNAYDVYVTATDNHDATATKHFSVRSTLVTQPANHPPVALGGATPMEIKVEMSRTQTSSTGLDLNVFFSDADSDQLSYTIVNPPGSGDFLTASITGSQLSLQGSAVITEPYILEVLASDGKQTGRGYFSITSSYMNTAPEAIQSDPEPVQLSVSSNGPLLRQLDMDEYFIDADGDELQYTILNPLSGSSGDFFSASLDGSQLTLQGTAPSAESYRLEVQASDGKLNVTKAFDVTAKSIDPVNHVPVVNPIVFEANENETYEGTLTAYDEDNDALTYTVDTEPTHGDYTLNDAGGFTYTPDMGYIGSDSMKVYVTDGKSDPQLINVTINVAPYNHDFVVQHIGNSNNEVHLYKEQAATIDLSKLFTDVDGDAAYEVSTTGAFLSMTKNDHYMTILAGTKPGDWEQFTVTANDGVHTATKMFAVRIYNPNFTKDESITNANAELGVPLDLSKYFADADTYPIYSAKVLNGAAVVSPSDSISSIRTLTSAPNSQSTISAAVDDTHGLTITSEINVYVGLVTEGIETQHFMRDGDVSYASIPLDQIFHNATQFRITSYDPDVISSLGSYSFEEWSTDPMLDVSSLVTITSPTTITIEGMTEAGDTATYTVTLDKAANLPPFGEDRTIDLYEDTPISGYFYWLDDGGSVTFNLAKDADHGEFHLNAEGTFTYTPSPGFYGTDTITYTMNDGELDSALITITFNVKKAIELPGNMPPVAEDATVYLNEDDSTSGHLDGSDPDGGTVSYQVVDEAEHGTFELDSETGNYSYTPDPDFFGTDTITYKLNDGAVDSRVITVTFVVRGVDDDIRKNSIFDENEMESGISLHPGDTAIIDLTKLFTSVDGDPVEYRIQGEPEGVHLVGDQLYILGSSSGMEQFTIEATDDVTENEEKFWALATIKVNGTYNSSLSDIYSTNSEAESQSIDLDAYFGGSYNYSFSRLSGNVHAALDATKNHLLLDFEQNDNSTIIVTASNGKGLTIIKEFHTYIGIGTNEIGVQTLRNTDGIRVANINLYSIFPTADEFNIVSYDEDLYSIDMQDGYLTIRALSSVDENDPDQWVVVEGWNSSDESATYDIRLRDNRLFVMYDAKGIAFNYEDSSPLIIPKGGSTTLTLSDEDGIDDFQVNQEGMVHVEVSTQVEEDGNTGTITLGGVESGYTTIYVHGYDNAGEEMYWSHDVIVYDAEVDLNDQLEGSIDLDQYLQDVNLDLDHLSVSNDYQYQGYQDYRTWLESDPSFNGTVLSFKALSWLSAGDYAVELPIADADGVKKTVILCIHIPETPEAPEVPEEPSA
ncbi:Ig-like domain-containing protein [Paenibacillus albus]|nr:Ig-like domain-containing protein [Paenibacillus albus]